MDFQPDMTLDKFPNIGTHYNKDVCVTVPNAKVFLVTLFRVGFLSIAYLAVVNLA